MARTVLPLPEVAPRCQWNSIVLNSVQKLEMETTRKRRMDNNHLIIERHGNLAKSGLNEE